MHCMLSLTAPVRNLSRTWPSLPGQAAGLVTGVSSDLPPLLTGLYQGSTALGVVL